MLYSKKIKKEVTILNGSIKILLLIQVVLIALNAVFASAELAVLSINETKLERLAEQGNKKAKRLYKLTQEPAKFLSTIQIAITLSGFLGSAFAADGFSEPLVNLVIQQGIHVPRETLDTIAVILITLILSYFTLVFGELVPKRIAMKKSEQLAMSISGLVSFISTAFKPIVWFLSVSTNLVLRLCGIDPTEAEDQVSEEEIRMLVDAGSEKGTIDYQEKEFIQNVFEFNDTMAGDIATHRTDVTILWMEDEEETWTATIHNSRHTLYPVCDGSPDNVIGILNAKDYFRLAEKTKMKILTAAVRPAYFVPKTIKADVLFRNMKKEHTSLAVVLDEYGGMVGIVTMNDLIEELVGDLGNDMPETGRTEPHIQQVNENTWIVIGNVELDDLEHILNVDMELENAETLTGLLFHELGKVPKDGEQLIEFELKGFQIQITRIENHQVSLAKITRPAASDTEPNL